MQVALLPTSEGWSFKCNQLSKRLKVVVETFLCCVPDSADTVGIKTAAATLIVGAETKKIVNCNDDIR